IDSEHPTPMNSASNPPFNRLSDGMAWVTNVVNSVMQSPDWNTSAIFITYDEFGGFYDHVVPPTIGGEPYGIRVPGLVITPWAKPGMLDSPPLTFVAYLKLVEDNFLGGQRINPATDGRPDSRPFVAEDNVPGDLINDFNFNQAPLPTDILPLHPNSPSPD